MKGIKGSKNKLSRLSQELTESLPQRTEPVAESALDTVSGDPWSGLTERQRTIQTLKLRGISQRMMAVALSCSEKTIFDEMAAIRQVHKKKGTVMDSEEYVGETLSIYEELSQEGWKGLSSIPEENPAYHQLQLQFLGFIGQMTREKTKMLMDLGLLQKAKIRVEHSLESEEVAAKVQQQQEDAAFMSRIKALGPAKFAELMISMGMPALQESTPDVEDAEIEEED
jgi:hypothetical protein